MCCKSFWKRIIPFILSLSLGLLVVTVLQKKSSADTKQEKIKPVNEVVFSTEDRGASGSCETADDDKNFQQTPPIISSSDVKPLRILSKPRAFYTDQARRNQIQGKVVLRVTFFANGQIGPINTISSLPDGLTETANAAARNIKFEPAERNRMPISVTKPIEYSFAIY